MNESVLLRRKKFPAVFVAGVIAIWSILFPLPVEASMEEALFAARNRHFDTAFKLFMTEAQMGSAEAQYRLAGMYRAGQGTQKDNIKAQTWYAKAAKQGHIKAAKRLKAFKHKTVQSPFKNSSLNSQLLKAVRKDDVLQVKSLLDSGADINAQDKFGITPLMEAVRFGKTDVTKILLKKGAKVNVSNMDGDTALLIAASLDNIKIVESLLAFGADINRQDAKKCTPLVLAIYRNDYSMASVFLKNKADVFIPDSKGRRAYDIAQGYKNNKLIALIKKAGGQKLARMLDGKKKQFNLSQLETQSQSNKERGWTPIMYSAWRGDKDAVKAALTKSANLDIKDKAGLTALALAAQGGHTEIIYMLLDAGADLRCGSTVKQHAFFIAVTQGQQSVVKTLLPALKGSPECRELLEQSVSYALRNDKMNIADHLLNEGVTFKGGVGQSPLIMMAKTSNEQLVSILIKSGVDVNAISPAGETALMVAAQSGNEAGIKSLISHNANVMAADNLGRTALIHAAQKGHINCVKYLTENGSDVLWLTQEGNTALMLAAEKGYNSVVSYLATYKNIDHKNNIGDTALIMAARGGYYNVTKELLEQGANPRMRNNKREKAQSAVHEKNKTLLALLDKYESSRSWLQDIF